MHRGELLQRGAPDEVVSAYTRFLDVDEDDATTNEDV
jgi:hypothetical protein